MASEIHPVLKQLLDLGCKDIQAAPVAFAVYMDLAEVKVVWDLNFSYCQELDIIYLIGKENESDSEPDIYLPLPASRNVSAAWLLKVQNTLPNKNKRLTLALKDADSTVVYYHISNGLVTPDSPEAVQNKKLIEEKKRLIQSELWRKRNQLYQSAKDNSDNEHV